MSRKENYQILLQGLWLWCHNTTHAPKSTRYLQCNYVIVSCKNLTCHLILGTITGYLRLSCMSNSVIISVWRKITCGYRVLTPELQVVLTHGKHPGKTGAVQIHRKEEARVSLCSSTSQQRLTASWIARGGTLD